MLKKLLGSQKKNAVNLLKKINISKVTAQYFTQYADLHSLLQSHDSPPLKFFIQAMKKQGFTPCYLLKCAVVTHYFFQTQTPQKHPMLMQFANCLMQKCNSMIHYLNDNCTRTEPNESRNSNLTNTTVRDDGFWMGKTYFLLKQIIRPYLAYILKFAACLKQDQKQPLEAQICEIWRDINLLNSIYGFANNFTIIGRYYLEQLGAFVVLLSQALSIDIKASYQRIEAYISFNQRLVCVHSDNREEQRQAQQFCKILEEIGCINQKFTQFYMGKYFYKYLQHLEPPRWIDINSKAFDRIFKGSNKENVENVTRRATKNHP